MDDAALYANRMLGGKLFGGSWNTDVSEMSVKGVCEMFSFGGRIYLVQLMKPMWAEIGLGCNVAFD